MRITYFGSLAFTEANGYIVHETDDSDAMASQLISIAGADGALDGYGEDRSPKLPKQVKVSLTIVPAAGSNPDAVLDTLMAACYGAQKEMQIVTHAGATRYALAKCIRIDRPHRFAHTKYMSVTLTFEMAEPYWYGALVEVGPLTVTTTPYAIELTTTCTAQIVKAQFRWSGSIKSPRIYNGTNGFQIMHTGDINAVWEIDTMANTIKLAGDDDYANCFQNFPATQVGLWRWEVGFNDVDLVAEGGGTPNGSFTYWYRPVYN